MAGNTHNLKNTIMRRIYYAYGLRLLLHPLTAHGAFVAVCAVLLTRFVSFPNVIANILEVKVGEVHQYILGAALQTEVWTVVLVVFIVLNIVWMYSRLQHLPRASQMGGVAYGQ
ncbi:MAG: hypothetical protein WDZ93_01925 [Candidatus Paceibacterota bacterium]